MSGSYLNVLSFSLKLSGRPWVKLTPASSFVPVEGDLGGRKEHVSLIFRDDSKVNGKILNFSHFVEFHHNFKIFGLCLSQLCGLALLESLYWLKPLLKG